MTALWAIVYICFILLTGQSLAGLFRQPGEAWHETAALSAALGSGATALILFWVSLAGARPSRTTLLALGAASLLCVILQFRNFAGLFGVNLAKAARAERTNVQVWGAGALIGVMMLIVGLHALSPLYEWDAFAIWGLKAKLLATQPLRPRPGYFLDPSLSFSHLDYPLTVPLLTAGVYGMMGEINDRWGKIWVVLVHPSLCLIVYGALRQALNAARAAALTALFISLPVLTRWAGAGTADVTLTLFYAGSLRYLAAYFERRSRRDLLLASLFTACAAFTKNEGLALAVVNSAAILCLVFPRPSWKKMSDAALFSAAWLALNLPWLVWSASIPRTNENYFGKLTISNIIQNSQRFGVILAEFSRQILRWDLWGGLWILLLIVSVALFLCNREAADMNKKKPGANSPAIWLLWSLLLAHIGIYALSFTLTNWDTKELATATLDRLFLHATPVVVLIIGIGWARLTPRSSDQAPA